MAKIKLTNSFSLIPEGTHVFKITNVTYKESFGKLEITMKTRDDHEHIERFSLLKGNGETNQGAYNAFSYFAKTAMNDFSLEEIDPDELVGCFIECDVTHDEVESTKEPGKMLTFARLGDKRVSDGWEDSPAPVKKATPLDLDSLLG